MFRPEQEVVVATLRHLIARGKNIELVARPGWGKSHVATLVALEHARQFGGKVVVVTPTNRLAEQLYERFKDAASAALIRGMAHFQCPVYNAPMAEVECSKYPAKERLLKFKCFGGPTKAKLQSYYIGIHGTAVYYRAPLTEAKCPYTAQFTAAYNAELIITNIAAFIRHTETGFFPYLPRGSVIIFDEAHKTLLQATLAVTTIPPALFKAALKLAKKRDVPVSESEAAVVMGYKEDCASAVKTAVKLLAKADALDAYEEFAVAAALADFRCKAGKDGVTIWRKAPKSWSGYTLIMLSVPPPIGAQSWGELGVKNVELLEAPDKIMHRLVVVLPKTPLSVSSKRVHMFPEYEREYARFKLLASAKELYIDGNKVRGIIEASWAPFRPDLDGYPQLENSKTVAMWEGIDVLEAVSTFLPRMPFHSLTPFWAERPSLYRAVAHKAFFNSLRGVRANDGSTVYLLTIDANVLEAVGQIADYFQLGVEIRALEAARAHTCYGEIDVMTASADKMKKAAACVEKAEVATQPFEQPAPPVSQQQHA